MTPDKTDDRAIAGTEMPPMLRFYAAKLKGHEPPMDEMLIATAPPDRPRTIEAGNVTGFNRN